MTYQQTDEGEIQRLYNKTNRQAARIEQLEAENARLREALATVASWGDGQTASERSMQRIARAAIQETDK